MLNIGGDHVKRYKLLLIGLLVGVFALGGCDAGNAPAGAGGSLTRCTGHFEAVVDQGPDKGLTLAGELVVSVDANGGMTGTLKSAGEAEVAVVGQVTGRAINLALDLGGGRAMFGTGTLFQPISECAGTAGGPLVGPEAVKTSASQAPHPAAPPGPEKVERNHGGWGYAICGQP
jgi:hypothetical protein